MLCPVSPSSAGLSIRTSTGPPPTTTRAAVSGSLRRSLWCPREQKARRNAKCVQLFAAIGVGFKSKLVWVESTIDPKTKKVKRQNAERYIEYLKKSGVIAHLKKNKGVIFQQDGARCHTAKKVFEFLEKEGVGVIRDWPAHSPDLNPSENLWKELDRLVAFNHGPADSVEELKRQVEDVWKKIPQSVIDRHVKSFGHKLAKCRANEGRR